MHVADRTPIRVVERTEGRGGFRFAELWRYRELLLFLVWRDILVRYKQTFLGCLWAVLQPVLTMVVFSIFFGRLAGLEAKTNGIPYPIFVYAALLPWTFFSSGVTASAGSVVANSRLVTKVYFPRILIPFASVGAALVDFGVAALVLIGMMVYYGVSFSFFWAPLFVLGTVLTTAGVSALLSALTVRYRDFRYTVPFMMQLWLFVTPVIYPSTLVPAEWKWLFALNPMAPMVEGFRAAVLGQPISWPSVLVAIVVAGLTFLVGVAYFQRAERAFADVI